MTKNACYMERVPGRIGSGLGAFTRRLLCDSGSVSVYAVAGMAVMMLFTGAAIDAMHSELLRSKMQNTADRAALAAAAMEQKQDGKTIVQSYFAAMDLTAPDTDMKIEQSSRTKTVWIDSHEEIATSVLQAIGWIKLDANAKSTATNEKGSVEVSLVLDISRSMNPYGKITQLKQGATNFSEQLFKQAGNRARVNVVPFAGSVNIGSALVEHIAAGSAEPGNDYGTTCVEVMPEDYASDGLPAVADTLPHFAYFPLTGDNDHRWGWCPKDKDAEVQFMLDKHQHVAKFVQGLPLYGGSAGDIGMKYGLTFLSPEMGDVIRKGAAAQPNAKTETPPSDWDDPATQKYIVLISDGENTQQFRPLDPTDTAQNDTVTLFARGPNKTTAFDTGEGWNYLSAAANARMLEQCTRAKERGVIIFTLGFGEAVGDDVLRACASSPAHYYPVTDGDLVTAMEAVSRYVVPLQLTR